MTREEAINILWMYDVNFEPHPAEEVMHAIDMAIEALQQPEIVRCEDCKYYRQYDDQDDLCVYTMTSVTTDGYCNYAERKEGEAE